MVHVSIGQDLKDSGGDGDEYSGREHIQLVHEKHEKVYKQILKLCFKYLALRPEFEIRYVPEKGV